ncbi:MAG TPA: hypothetical protein VGH48_12345 [Caldimonas sp.]
MQGATDGANLSRTQIAAIVASTDRSDADRRNDVRRKPVDMLEFAAVRPGMTVLDVSSGGGYTTELLARAVVPSGRVFAQTPRPPSPGLAERLKTPAAANVVSVVRPFESAPPPELPAGFDLVTLMFNYHDMGHLGVDRARMNAAIFAALKPGGAYVIADHSGRPGTGISESGTLHRVEEALVRREVEAAGFRLAAEGMFLRNPNDPRDRNETDTLQPKDEFVLRFVKP